MDRPSDSQSPTNKAKQNDKKVPLQYRKAPPKPITNPDEYTLGDLYLILYNWISAVLWAAILGRTVLHGATDGYERVYDFVGTLVKYTQTLAATECLNSSFGLVRAAFFPTLVQVASRFVLVWLIVENFPDVAGRSPAYMSMLIAWSLTETLRYSYFTYKLAVREVPGWLTWLRYTTFLVLYPLGILSEMYLALLVAQPARQKHWSYEWHIYALLSFYVPGAWILFNHMLEQRQKVLFGSDKKKAT